MIVLIDNYDSFSYNLYQLIGAVDPDIRVFRNDAVTVDEIAALEPDAIVLSPGPGRPEDAGICEDIVLELGASEDGPDIPILGVCLGHQAIVEALGGTVGYAKRLMHGKPSRIVIDGRSRLLRGLPEDAQVARYHSLAAVRAEGEPNDVAKAATADGESSADEQRGERSSASAWPDDLLVTATDEHGEIMAVEHARHPIFGLQFHPESILTPDGPMMMERFIELAREEKRS